MKIKLPWKTKGYDGKYYQATLTFLFSNTQIEEMLLRMEKRGEKATELIKEKTQTKRNKSGLRKCPGHKFLKIAIYNEHDQCSICRGYRKYVN